MPYDSELADRVRACAAGPGILSEKKMFGGLAFMLNGHMLCGVIEQRLMLRVGREQDEALLRHPHVRPMDFTGRPMRGMIYVEPEGLGSDEKLSGWIERARAFVESLPPK